ncbi:MAG: GNAT family N-acetyltransferase, partial [Caulobacteraceae bacterium]
RPMVTILLTALAKAANSLGMAQTLDEVFILPAGPGDADGLARVHVQAWRETYQGLLPDAYLDRMSLPLHAGRFRAQLAAARPREVVLTVESAAGLIGYCAGETGEGAAEVFTLYLLRRSQGRGLGRRLLTAWARAAVGGGARRLGLWVLEGNLRARAFYRHLGAAYAERRPARGFAGRMEVRYDWPDIDMLADSSE